MAKSRRYTIEDIIGTGLNIKELGPESRIKKKKKTEKEDYSKLFFDLKQLGVPAPVQEHRFHPVRKWRLDFAWPDIKLGLEIEGGVFRGGRHTTSINGFLGDMEKYNALGFEGWFLLRSIPRDIKSGDTAVLIYNYFKVKHNELLH